METTMAERLRYLRKKNKLSQTAVAKQIGVTSSLISAFEKQERRPSIDTLVSLADIYHVSTDYILGRVYRDDSTIAINVENLNDKQIKIIRELVENMNSGTSAC